MTDELQKYFAAERRAVGRAREFVITSLERWGITGEPAEDIRLCASELASNALVHGTRGGHGFLVRLCADEDSVRLEVHDSRDVSPDRLPHVREATDTDTAGRGLSLVDTLADDWGLDERSPYGKVVWSRFKAVPTPQPACPLEIA
ncbi:ATP-binding protein [Streptomyces sp. NBC_01795]|uniref:ATP-binding protein n=1 Tax=unclassified Streptomyces TaxID=2593676 RepID=UPI002DDA9CD0|nr:MULTISPECIES: ATP-binding protein [unclassified Streptomyces]WSA92800.1 ATP-binding protein [Streptomyces sp. NBC_01795]WSB77170.1 ATP-binding protein [Streptomyces sp. NBC_01775]WSS14565.1 ATP-binding protein [Streptomyces sp. NBC_01186]